MIFLTPIGQNSIIFISFESSKPVLHSFELYNLKPIKYDAFEVQVEVLGVGFG